MKSRLVAWTAALLILSGCQPDDDGIEGHNQLVSAMERTRVGKAADHWIEMKNLSGQWERTGLIFGYVDDYEECQKAIAGLRAANFAREYRCVPANR